MGQLINKNGVWVENDEVKADMLTVTSLQGATRKLLTKDTYVDKDIEIHTHVQAGSLKVEGGDLTTTATVTANEFTTDTPNDYAIEFVAGVNAAEVNVSVEDGLVDSTKTAKLEAGEDQAKKTVYLKQGHLAAEGEAEITTNMKNLTKVNVVPETGFYVKASASGSVTVDQAGWLPKNATAESEAEAIYTIKAASLANAEGSETYVEATAPVLTEDGYLYINEGYMAPTKISLATLVPDDAVIPGVVDGKSDLMYNTVAAYDSDGKLIAGTMGDAVLGDIVANDAQGTVATVTVTEEDGVFKVGGQGTISGTASVAVAERGLATTETQTTGTVSGTVKVDATLDKIALGATAEQANVEVKPVITEATSTVITGDVTTTAPTTGKYVAVKTSAIAANAVVTPNVATAGYGTVDTFDATATTVKAGAAAADVAYVPVQAGSHDLQVTEPTVVSATATVATNAVASNSIALDGVLTAAPEGKPYITISTATTKVAGTVNATATDKITEGYMDAAQDTKNIQASVGVAVTEANNKFIRIYDGEFI